ncbi:MAG: MFS transporter [Rhodospirillaceae bacterium]|nr:MFS transporter [Rhodospirillaceae bacterium]
MTANGRMKNSTKTSSAGAISQAIGDTREAAGRRATAAAMRGPWWPIEMLPSTTKDGSLFPVLREIHMASKLPLLLLLIAVTCLSQFYRVSNSVIAPELAGDLHLSARQLGWAGSAFFFALFAVQIPVGLWFDRFGARRTVAALSLLAMLGSIWIARANDASDLIVGRTIVGVGCAASFMSVVFLCSRWFAPARLSTALSWVFAASNIGTLAAATPLAWIAATAGWRQGFLGLSAVTLLVAILFYAIVRDRPPEARQIETRHETLGEIFRGLVEVWRTPSLLAVLSMHFFAYATMLTVLGVWAVPISTTSTSSTASSAATCSWPWAWRKSQASWPMGRWTACCARASRSCSRERRSRWCC